MSKRARGRSLWMLLATMAFSSASTLAEEVERFKFNMTEGVTPVSREIHSLHMEMFWWCVGIGVIVFGIMLFSMLVHRKSLGAKAAQFHENTTLEILWTAIPIVILILMALPATKTLIKLYDTTEADIDIIVTGYQWRWKYDYVADDVSFFSSLSTPHEQIIGLAPKGPHYLLEVDEPMVVPINKKIRFLITSNDVIHAWWVPAFGIKRDAIPGFIKESWAVITEPGIYRGQCAELCGKDHGFMPIVVQAVSDEEYQTWIGQKQQEAAAIKELTAKTFTFDELYQRGEGVYQRACAACHQASGEGIPPTFPALKASPVATGDIKHHIDIVVNGVKNTAMQAFGGQLSEVDIAAVVTYERNAWGNNMADMTQPIDIYNHKQGK